MLCSAVAFVEGYDPKIKLSQKRLNLAMIIRKDI